MSYPRIEIMVVLGSRWLGKIAAAAPDASSDAAISTVEVF